MKYPCSLLPTPESPDLMPVLCVDPSYVYVISLCSSSLATLRSYKQRLRLVSGARAEMKMNKHIFIIYTYIEIIWYN